MKERPILFSTPMVQALLGGRKTMTRRMVKFPKDFTGEAVYPNGSLGLKYTSNLGGGTIQRLACPFGQVGDRLWVRETFCLTQPFDPETYYFGYKCGSPSHSKYPAGEKYDYSTPDKWKPSIHMPRSASRIMLDISGIKVERLQDISETDSINEGVMVLDENWVNTHFPEYFQSKNDWISNGRVGHPPIGPTPKERYEELWKSLYGPGSWYANPWVWIIEFKRI